MPNAGPITLSNYPVLTINIGYRIILYRYQLMFLYGSTDFHHFPHDNCRDNYHDVPERFHAGRESLSVRRNITIRDSKRPKERSQDRDYKQRYSLTPGKQVGQKGFGMYDGGDHFDQRLSVHTGGKQIPPSYAQQSSGGHSSSPVGITMRQGPRSPLSVPSPKTEDQIPERQNFGGVSRDDYPFHITLIYEGDRVQHQVWRCMPVAQLTQEAAGLFDLPPPITSVVLMD